MDVTESLAEELAALHTASYGVAPNRVRAHVLDDLVVCLMDVELLPNERIVADHGLGAGVRDLRATVQELERPRMIAAVERVTGSRVVAFLSEMHINPTFCVEIFRLAGGAPN